MGRDWQRRAAKVEKRRRWRQSNKAVSQKEKRGGVKQKRQKTKEEIIWEFHEGDLNGE